MTTTDRWITRPRPVPRARLRLFCLAHAGGGASSFRGWADVLPPEVEVCPVQLPGRENRIAEPAFSRMEPLVAELADAVRPWTDIPYAVFGHSIGALVGFELARAFRAQGEALPAHLFASGRRAPDVPNERAPTSTLPDDAFLADLQELGGIPQALLDHPELVQLLLPLLRADVSLNETYTYRPEPPLDVPLTAYGGERDAKVRRASLEAWSRQTTGPFELRMFPGGHFFHQEARDAFLSVLASRLRDVVFSLSR